MSSHLVPPVFHKMGLKHAITFHPWNSFCPLYGTGVLQRYSVAQNGTLFVADLGNNCIRRISTSLAVSTVAGNGLVSSIDGQGTSASIYQPWGVTVGSDGSSMSQIPTTILLAKYQFLYSPLCSRDYKFFSPLVLNIEITTSK